MTKLDWPALNKDDKLKAVRRGRFWVIRAEQRRRLDYWEIKDGVLTTYDPSGKIVIEINGQDLLGRYTTKKRALGMIAKLDAARKK